MARTGPSIGAFLLREFQEIFLCCTELELDAAGEDAAQQALSKWRPRQGEFQLNQQKKKGGAEEQDGEDDDDDASGDAESVASGSEKGKGAASDHSSEKSDEDEDDDEDADADNEKMQRTIKKVICQMEFEPLLAVEDGAVGDMVDPADLLKDGGKKKRRRRRGRPGGMDEKVAVEWVRKILDHMKEEHKDVELPDEAAVALETDAKVILEAVEVAGPGILDIHEDDEGNKVLEKTLAQKIIDEINDSDEDTLRLKELCDLLDCDEDEVVEAVENSDGCLVKMDKKRGALIRKVCDLIDADQLDDSDDDGAAKEADKRAMEFRREQVQRKVEEFLMVYSKGVNLTKVATNGKRYHRRVYVDTAKKSLVIQGASGPKMFAFATMRDIDMETRTTKEGRTETLVIIALERGGRIVRELTISFPDQHKGNQFVNCLSLFSMALRQG